MAVMVAMERHLWLNLADIGEKEKNFLLDAPVSPSELFCTSVETVIGKFREAKVRLAAFKTFMPRRSKSKPQAMKGVARPSLRTRGKTRRLAPLLVLLLL